MNDITPEIIKQQEKNLKSDLLQRVKAYLYNICVNTPKITAVKIHGFRVISVNDRGMYERFFDSMTFTFTDTYMFRGELHTTTKQATYQGRNDIRIND